MGLMALPRPDYREPAEGYAPRQPATTCIQVPQPGVVAFRDFTRQRLGGGDLGILIGCDERKSEHQEGRAWDWALNAGDPADRARAEAMIDWLLETGPTGEPHENFRRAGLRYMIWDRQISLQSGSKKSARKETLLPLFETKQHPLTWVGS